MVSAGINAKRRCFDHSPKESGVCSRWFPGRCASFPTLAPQKSAAGCRSLKRQLLARMTTAVFGSLRGQSDCFRDAKHQVQTLNCHAGCPLAEVVETCHEQHMAGCVGKNTK